MECFEAAVIDIICNDSARQRKLLTDIADLVQSIERRGLLQPIIIDDGNRLIAGRRRLEAYRHLGRTTIPTRRLVDLTDVDRKLVELDENIRRQDINWKDKALAIADIHDLPHDGAKGDGELKDTAERIGLDAGLVGKYVKAARELRAGNQRILDCTSINQATEIINRMRSLTITTAISQIGEDESDPAHFLDVSPAALVTALSPPVKVLPTLPTCRIEESDFLEFAVTYSGPKFNFVHCDFPYGIGIDKSDAAGSATHESQYEDSPEVFWALTDALLKNRSRLFLDSAHLMFWYSRKFEQALLDKLTAAGFGSTITH
jgi:ParB/RepB/Spo0J family partition protein